MAHPSWPTRIALSSLLLPLALACSGEGGLSDGAGSTVNPGTGGSTADGANGGGTSTGASVAAGASTAQGSNGGLMVDPIPGGSGGGSSAPAMLDGGTVVLTQEEVTQIEESECTGVSAAAEKAPAVLQFVVDVSMSMGLEAPGAAAGITKWDVTRDALQAALDALAPEMAVGMQFYPTSQGFGSCVDESGQTPIDLLGPAGSDHRLALEQDLNTAQLVLYTPTHDGYSFALNEGLLPSAVNGQKSMVLITDGAPTTELGCGMANNAGSPTQPIVDEIAAAQAQGIRTYVIGSPGSEINELPDAMGEDMRGWLSAAAVAGGTASDGCAVDGPNFCHFDMTEAPDFAVALAEGLAAISESVTDLCTFEMPEPPEGMTSTDINLTSVIIKWSDGTAELVQRDDLGDCTEGWIVNDAGQIALCGNTCTRVEMDVAAEATVSMGCDPAVIVVR